MIYDEPELVSKWDISLRNPEEVIFTWQTLSPGGGLPMDNQVVIVHYPTQTIMRLMGRPINGSFSQPIDKSYHHLAAAIEEAVDNHNIEYAADDPESCAILPEVSWCIISFFSSGSVGNK